MQNTLDDTMLSLLAQGVTMPLGIPTWVLKDAASRLKPSTFAAAVWPRNKTRKGACEGTIVDRYDGRQGYQFSWGTVTEERHAGEWDEEEQPFPTHTFEIFPDVVTAQFPNALMLADLYQFMYNHHPGRNLCFDTDEPLDVDAALSFTVDGNEEEVAALRNWLVSDFLPNILPELNAEATRIIEARRLAAKILTSKYDEEVALLTEHERFQMCPNPEDLSFRRGAQ